MAYCVYAKLWGISELEFISDYETLHSAAEIGRAHV